MTLDGAGQLGGNNTGGEALPARHRPRLSPPGCAMLALLLRFPQVIPQMFANIPGTPAADCEPGQSCTPGYPAGGTS